MRGFVLVLVMSSSSVAGAATLSGTVTNQASTPLSGVEVRAWSVTAKGPTVSSTTTTNGSGAWSFPSLQAGTWQVSARATTGTQYAERWFSTTGTGDARADAADIVLTQTGSRTGVVIRVASGGGMDGVVNSPDGRVANALVRTESIADGRIFQDSVTTSLGVFSPRALLPGIYRAIAWDADAMYETGVGAWTQINSGSNATGPTIQLQPMEPDGNEPNNSVMQPRASIESLFFRLTPPEPFESTSALIGPRNTGDIDLYCFDALVDDRFIIEVRGEMFVESMLRDDPHLDPVVGFFAYPPAFPNGFTPPPNALVLPDGLVWLAENDDENATSRASRLDTGVITQQGRYCAVVTTFGDTLYQGTGQGTAGRYKIRIAMGNRPPSVSAMFDVDGTMAAPPVMDEGQRLRGRLVFSDPDGDALSLTWQLRDAQGTVVAGGSVDTANPAFTWDASQVAARASPYALRISVNDGELTRTLDAPVTVRPVNLTPGMTSLISPDDGAVVMTSTPALVCSAVSDPDLDVLQYEFEVRVADGGVVLQSGSVTTDGGTASMVANPLPDNIVVEWRARASDGNPQNGTAGWTESRTFFVNARNDPPEAAMVLSPTIDEVVTTKRPVIVASVPRDPEGDAVQLVVEVAEDAMFTMGVLRSPALMGTGESVQWMVESDLAWGTGYFVRVSVEDVLGAPGGLSPVVPFRLKDNEAPVVTLGAPFGADCGDTVLMAAPAAVVVTVADPEMEPVSLRLQIFFWIDDPATGVPVLDRNRGRGEPVYSFDISTVDFVRDYKYRVRARASDGTLTSEWTECGLTVSPPPSSSSSRMVSSSMVLSSSLMESSSSSEQSSSEEEPSSVMVSSSHSVDVPDAGEGGTTEPGCACGASSTGVPVGWLALALVIARRRSVRR